MSHSFGNTGIDSRVTGDDIFQYKETCEVLLDYPKTGGGDIKDVVKKVIMNILNASIDVHNRRLIVEFPGYGVKFIEKLQSHCANITFSDKVGIT